MYDVVSTRNMQSVECNGDNNNHELDEGLNEQLKTPQKYAVDPIVRTIGKGNNVKYVVQWYGYTSADDTFQPPNHIPQHLITHYSRLVRVK